MLAAHGTLGLPFDEQPPASSLSKVSLKKQYGASMVTQAITHGGDFFCPHCGAQYVVSYSVYCDVCRRKLIQWDSSQEPFYSLMKPPDRKGGR